LLRFDLREKKLLNDFTEHDVRPANNEDLEDISTLLKSCNLPVDGIEECLDSTLIIKNGYKLIACAALELYGKSALLRSVAVDKNYRSTGLGIKITKAILEKAKNLDITNIYLLTETADKFFPRFNFQVVSRDKVPADVKTSLEFTSLCPESAVAMQLELKESAAQK
jgi:amino-acid N-acetyltransferase